MVTWETLSDWMKKCLDAKNTIVGQLKATEEELEKKEAYKRRLQDHMIAVNAQIETLEQLMDIEKNPPHVELPAAGPDLEKSYADRLKGWDNRDEMDMYKERQEKTYRREAQDLVEQIHAVNESTKREDAKVSGTDSDS